MELISRTNTTTVGSMPNAIMASRRMSSIRCGAQRDVSSRAAVSSFCTFRMASSARPHQDPRFGDPVHMLTIAGHLVVGVHCRTLDETCKKYITVVKNMGADRRYCITPRRSSRRLTVRLTAVFMLAPLL